MHCFCEPINDDYRWYDPVSRQYILKEKALLDYGINIRPEVDDATYSETVISSVLKRVSRKVYNYIHAHSIYNDRQDWIIAHIPRAGQIVYEALLSQALYMWINGDLGLLPKKGEAEISNICVDCQNTLATSLCELGGKSLLYCGV